MRLVQTHRPHAVSEKQQAASAPFDRWRVEQAGTHEQLMAMRDRYAELFDLRAAGYR